MSSFKTILLISKILSYDSNTDALTKLLTSEHQNWDDVVKIASKHLILPTLYNRLKKKNQLHLVPSELKDFLQEISKINYNRNLAILKQAQDISLILVANNIDHVFLKGTALIALDNHDLLLERMIGDIDILVEKSNLSMAHKLIEQQNYSPVKQTFGDSYFEHKHLPRLIPKKAIAAIEIHRKLLTRHNETLLEPINILSKKVKTKTGLFVPNTDNLLKHVIYNHQINDKGFYYDSFSFRSIYDVLTIQNTQNINKAIEDNRYTKKFFNYASTLFCDFKSSQTIYNRFIRLWFVLKVKHKSLYNIVYQTKKSIFFIKIIASRSLFFISNSNYRRDIIKDHKRVLNTFFSQKKLS